MERSNKVRFGVLALVALALMTAYMVGATTLGGAFAAPPSQTATGSSAQQPPATGATSVHVDRDGTRTERPAVEQTGGDANKQATSDTNQKLLDNFMTNFTSRLGVDEAKLNSAFIETMHKIGVTDDEWRQGLDAGKSLADIAAAHNVDAATLKSMILTAYRS